MLYGVCLGITIAIFTMLAFEMYLFSQEGKQRKLHNARAMEWNRHFAERVPKHQAPVMGVASILLCVFTGWVLMIVGLYWMCSFFAH